jgi:hypothetical protein
MIHGIDTGSWEAIIPSSGPSMQGGREKFHHQIFSLVVDREELKIFPKSPHVRLRTFCFGASKTREEILITRRHLPGISRDSTHI